MSPNANGTTNSTSPILEARTISNNDGVIAFNALFNNNPEAEQAAVTKLKANWSKWADAFDAQWYDPTDNNAKIMAGKKLAQEVENAKVKVAQAIKQAIDGQQVSAPVTPPTYPVNNDDAVVAFYLIFKSPEVADKQVSQLVINWNKWVVAFGGEWFDPSYYNAKVVAGRLIAKAMADAKARVVNAIQQAINGNQITSISDRPNNSSDNRSITQTQAQLEHAKNRTEIYKQFVTTALNMGANSDNLPFLYEGIEKSPYKQEINQFPDRLNSIPDGQNVVSYGKTILLKNSNKKVTFSHYPQIGKLPKIDKQGLDFLHEDIQEACLCIGSFVGNELQTHWLGRNALRQEQFWSSTKFISILNVVSRANGVSIDSKMDNCFIRERNGGSKNYPVYELAVDVVSYEDNIASSNSLGAMFKRFDTSKGLENWVKQITGNNDLEFRGGYGEPPFINNPELVDLEKQEVLLTAASEFPEGNNLVSAYDLTRFISMLGWHHHIGDEARLPDAQWNSLQTIVRAMGTSASLYTENAIQILGLQDVISSPVIISKLGNGYSDTRKTYEIVYVALVQFVDELPKADEKPAKLRTCAMALRGATSGDAVKLDARMAAEVTEILRRIVTEELA